MGSWEARKLGGWKADQAEKLGGLKFKSMKYDG
jgi:hypothetical protein